MNQEKDRERSRAAGFEHHLVKPVDVEFLRGLLAQTPGQQAHDSDFSAARERKRVT